jgi:protein TonB
MATWKGTAWDYAGYRQAQRRWREQIALPAALGTTASAVKRPQPCLLAAGALALLLHAAAFDWLPLRHDPVPMPQAPRLMRIKLGLPAHSAAPPAPAKPGTSPAPSAPQPAPPAKSAAHRPAAPRMPILQHADTTRPAIPRLPPATPEQAPKAPGPGPAKMTETAAPAPSAPPAAAAPPSNGPDTAARADADYLHNPAPDYPEFALSHGWGGRVLLHVHVLANGRPDQVELQRGTGHKVLDEAARSAVQGWSFVPAKHGGVPVDSWVVIPVEFNTVKGSAP